MTHEPGTTRWAVFSALVLAIAACTEATAPSKGPTPRSASRDASESTTECVVPMAGVFDNVVVPAGGNCKLIASQVEGFVHVLAGGSLEVLGSRIEGDVLADPGHLSLGIGGIALSGGVQGSFIGGN